MYWRIFGKPLGMARTLEAILSIASFACTIDFHGSVTFSIACPHGSGSVKESLNLEWSYPFRLTSIMVNAAKCNQSILISQPKYEQVFLIDFGVQAQFFVFVGVCSFLISMGWVIFYLACWQSYFMDIVVPTADLVVSIITAVFWLCADCSWASAYSIMQMYLSPDHIQRSINTFPFCQNGGKCILERHKQEFGNAGFGLTLGFVNCVMWVLNAFLAYREQRRIRLERDRLMYTADAFYPHATTAENMDATSINPRLGFRDL